MILAFPYIECDKCGFPFDTQSWNGRHTPGLFNYHESCCPEWDCNGRYPDCWTPGMICEWIEGGNWRALPSDWQKRLWCAGYRLPLVTTASTT